MRHNILVHKSNKKLENFKKHFEPSIIDECDALFITEEYDKNNVHLIFKREFYKFIEENDNNLNIVEYKKSIETVSLPNSSI